LEEEFRCPNGNDFENFFLATVREGFFSPLPLSNPTRVAEVVIQSEAWNLQLPFFLIGGRVGENIRFKRKQI